MLWSFETFGQVHLYDLPELTVALVREDGVAWIVISCDGTQYFKAVAASSPEFALRSGGALERTLKTGRS